MRFSFKKISYLEILDVIEKLIEAKQVLRVIFDKEFSHRNFDISEHKHLKALQFHKFLNVVFVQVIPKDMSFKKFNFNLSESYKNHENYHEFLKIWLFRTKNQQKNKNIMKYEEVFFIRDNILTVEAYLQYHCIKIYYQLNQDIQIDFNSFEL